VVPALVLEDGTAIGEVPAIMRYLDEAFPETPMLGATPKDKALIVMWERFAELEGFAAVMEGVRNRAERLKGRAVAGPHGYEQIPALVNRSMLRAKNFLADLNGAARGGVLRRRRSVFGSGHNRADDDRFRQGARPIGSAGAPSADALEGCGFGAAQLKCLTQIVAKPECIDPSFANSGYP
jgi:glutathione S-transferase